MGDQTRQKKTREALGVEIPSSICSLDIGSVVCLSICYIYYILRAVSFYFYSDQVVTNVFLGTRLKMLIFVICI